MLLDDIIFIYKVKGKFIYRNMTREEALLEHKNPCRMLQSCTLL